MAKADTMELRFPGTFRPITGFSGEGFPQVGFGSGGFTLAKPSSLMQRYQEMEPIVGKEKAQQLVYELAAKEDPIAGATNELLRQALYQNTPEGRAEAAKQMLEIERARGNTAFDYALKRDIIANLGSIGRAAFSRVSDPNAIYRGMQDIANAGVQGAQSNAGLAQQIAGSSPRVRYFT